MMPRSKLRRKDRASAGRVHAKKSAKLIQPEQSDAVPPVSRSAILRALNLNDFLSTPSFRSPEKIVASAWHEHAAFAFWLVEQLSPRMLVELGTHKGFSYFAFCQAIRMAGLSTAAFAVDCWTGDEHAGHYGEEVYQSVEAFNMERYPDISTLMKMSFEDALPYFEEGSVDILHIDGSHYFDDVKSDFESWLPKLSNRAVVLFHDTNVRERKFGVHLLWSQVCERYPNFNFIHGHGLGVLGVGKDCPTSVAALFTACADPVLTASIRNAYARLGGAVTLSFRASEAARLQIAAQCSAAELANALNRRDEEMLRIQSRLAEVQDSLEQNIASAAELDLVRLGNAQLNNECEALRQRISYLSDEQQRQRAGAEDATAKLKEALEGTLTALSAERQKTAEQTDRLADLEEHQRTVADSRAAAVEEARQLRAELAVQARITAEQSGVIGSLRIVQSRSEKENAALVCRIDQLQRALSDEQATARAALANAAELKSAFVGPASWRFLQPFRWIGGELQRRSYRRLILDSGLFDRNWYLKNYPDVRRYVDPVLNYLKFGAMEGRDPSALFDTDWYLQQNPDVRAAGINPLVHYLRYGAREGRDCRCSVTPVAEPNTLSLVQSNALSKAYFRIRPYFARRSRRTMTQVQVIEASGTFSVDWYQRQCSEPQSEPILHYLLFGARLGLNPSPLFDSCWYLLRYPDVAAGRQNPLLHYLMHGGLEGRDPGPLFASKWYSEQHSEVAKQSLTPLAHYLTIGRDAGHVTTPLFDEPWYRESVGQGLQGHQDPFTHFVEVGFLEGRDPGPFFSSSWYRERYSEIAESGLPPLWHYTVSGAYRGLSPGPLFDATWYHRRYHMIAPPGTDALSEFLTIGGRAGRLPTDPAPFLRGARIAIIAHLYYVDVWPQILEALGRIPIEFDLFVTTPEDQLTTLGDLVQRTCTLARLIPTANRGRDIGAFFEAIYKIGSITEYTAICKIHTKKGISEHPDVWRHVLLDSVLGSSALIRDIVRGFIDNPDLGIVGSRDLYFSGPKFIGPNQFHLERITQGLSAGMPLPTNWGFFAGTMFWVKPEILEKLSHFVAETLTFETDTSQNDGQIAHALERVFGILPALTDHKIGLVESIATGPVPHMLRIYSPPAWPRDEEPAHYLRRRSRELKGQIFVAGA
jgi:hypothetical protein